MIGVINAIYISCLFLGVDIRWITLIFFYGMQT